MLVAFCKINEKLKIKELIFVKGTTNLKIKQSYIKIGYRIKTLDVSLWVSHNLILIIGVIVQFKVDT